MPLDPRARALLDQTPPPLAVMTPRKARAQMEADNALLGPLPAVARVEDRTLPGGLQVRITTPEGPGPFPILVYFHGGGWVVGSLDSHDGICRWLTRESGIVVVSVAYRLAPEHPFPAAVDDAYAATAWAAAHAATFNGDPARLAVGGDSAGGNLAAVVALQARDRGGPLVAGQLLIYPVLDCDLDTPSYLENADGYLLTRAAMAWFWGLYVPRPEDRRDPRASPLRAADLSNLPPALVITAEYDPLRDEAEAYSQRLGQAGVPVQLTRYPGMIHGFVRRHALFDQGQTALAECAAYLRNGFTTKVQRTQREET